MGAEAAGVNSAPSSAPTTGKGILSSVDGGKDPVFGVEEISARKENKTPDIVVKDSKKNKKQEVKPEPPSQLTKTPEKTEAPNPYADIEKLIASEWETAQTQETPSEDPNEDEQSRGDRRFQDLSNRLKESTQKNQVFEQQFNQLGNYVQQLTGYIQQMEQRSHQADVRNAKLEAMLEHMSRGQKPEEQDPLERLKSKLSPALMEEFKAAMKPYADKADRLENILKNQAETERRTRTVQSINHNADSAARDVLLAGFGDEDIKELQHHAGTAVLAWAYGRNIPPAEAAKSLRQFMAKYSLALIRAKSNGNKQKIEAGNKVQPPSAQGQGVPGRGNALPNFDDMKKIDPKAKDALDFMFRHAPE